MAIVEDERSQTSSTGSADSFLRDIARAAPRTPVPSLTGDVVDGKYRVAALLGRGGMGAVYLATHLGTGRAVALKVLAPELIADDDAIERFKREALLAGRIRHPNVVDVTDFGFAARGDERFAYLVMELLGGQTLRARLDTSGPLPLDLAIDVLGQICAGVSEAHALGVLHRDLKPENINLEPQTRGQYRVKVLDFGIAKLLGPSSAREGAVGASDGAFASVDPNLAATVPVLGRQNPPKEGSETDAGALTAFGAVVGTPRYIAPEQWLGRPPDARADVYSLGVLAYEVLAGRPPFLGSRRSIAMEHQMDPPPSLAQMAPSVPRGVVRLIESALAKDPADRPASASAFAAALRARSETTGRLIRQAVAMCLEHYKLFFRPAAVLSMLGLAFPVLALASSLLARRGLVSSRVDLWLGAALSQLPPLLFFPLSVALVGVVVPMVADLAETGRTLRPPSFRVDLWRTFRDSLPTSLVKLVLLVIAPPLVLMPIVKLFHLDPLRLATFSALSLASEALAYVAIAPLILTGPIVAVERLRGLAPLRRSVRLVWPMLPTAIGVLLVWHLLYQVINISFMLSTTMLAGARLEDALATLHEDRFALIRSTAWRVSAVLQALVFVALWPFGLIPGALLYLRAREAEGAPVEGGRGSEAGTRGRGERGDGRYAGAALERRMPPTVHLLCGKTGSGKTTFARALERERKAVCFSPDAWMIELFGHHMERALFDARLASCKALIYGLTERLAQVGVDVVLDFGFWSRAERDAARARIAGSGARCVLYFFDAAEGVLRERLKGRNADLPAGTFEITEEMFEGFGRVFEPPGEDEGCVRIG